MAVGPAHRPAGTIIKASSSRIFRYLWSPWLGPGTGVDVRPRYGFDHDRGSDAGMLARGEVGAHQLEQRGREQRVDGQVIDALWLAVDDLNLTEAGPFELADEVVLSQGSGRAAGPGSRMVKHFGREVVFLDGHVGDA
jgi:hypothetical protein